MIFMRLKHSLYTNSWFCYSCRGWRFTLGSAVVSWQRQRRYRSWQRRVKTSALWGDAARPTLAPKACPSAPSSSNPCSASPSTLSSYRRCVWSDHLQKYLDFVCVRSWFMLYEVITTHKLPSTEKNILLVSDTELNPEEGGVTNFSGGILSLQVFVHREHYQSCWKVVE